MEKMKQEVLQAGEVPTVQEFIERAWGRFKRGAFTLIVLQSSIYVVVILAIVAFRKILDLIVMITESVLPTSAGPMAFYLPHHFVIVAIVIVVVFALYIVFAVLSFVSVVYSSLALVYAATSDEMGIREAFGKARKRLAEYTLLSMWREFLIGMGSLLFLPGLVFEVWYTFFPFVFALEGKRGMNALARSRELVSSSRKIWAPVLIIELPDYIIRVLPRKLSDTVSAIVGIILWGATSAPLFVLFALMAVFFIGMFAILGVPLGIYLVALEYLLLFAVYVFPFVVVFCLNIFMIFFYFELYKAATTLESTE